MIYREMIEHEAEYADDADAKRWARRRMPAASRISRTRYSQSHFEDVAKVYRDAYGAGMNPATAVSDHFGMTAYAAAYAVRRARELGKLAPAPGQGQAGLEKKGRKQ